MNMDQKEHASEPGGDQNYNEKIEKMVMMTVAAAKGIAPLVQVALPLAQIARSELAPPEARELAKTLSRILRGERDPIGLVQDLPPELAEVVWDALEQIEAPLPDFNELEREEITFEQLIEKVAEACSGEVLLWQQLWHLSGALSTDARTPPEMQALGLALRKILAGERQKHVLDELADEHRWAVEQLLDWLNEQAVVPE
jgi:hypothetical protein